ncbi:thioredoxin-like protein [Daldinia eschscholtzii]|nr:thioredoxin-like protein [Daldinia eschscholtzii]
MASIRDLLLPADDRDAAGAVVKKEDEDAKTDVTSGTARFIVEFILDVICPYCYIGFKNLKAAIETYRVRHPEAVFKIVCLPFLLHPLADRSAYDKSDYLISRTRGPEHWVGLGEAAGINFTWTGRTGSTRDAHKLLRFALESTPTPTRGGRNNRGAPTPSSRVVNGSTPIHGPAVQLRLLEALFRAHHESDGDISDPSFLASTTSAVTGFTTARIRHVLEDESGEWKRAVDALVAQVSSPRGLAVRAVPTFVVNDRYVIGGVQSAEFLVEEFERIRRGGAR